MGKLLFEAIKTGLILLSAPGKVARMTRLELATPSVTVRA
jgi:hypothetical protein